MPSDLFLKDSGLFWARGVGSGQAMLGPSVGLSIGSKNLSEVKGFCIKIKVTIGKRFDSLLEGFENYPFSSSPAQEICQRLIFNQ